MIPGSILIMEERLRQKSEEGYSPEHDAKHVDGELAKFACCYALDPMEVNTSLFVEFLKPIGWVLKLSYNGDSFDDNIEGRIRDLTKAGALLAAEIDRLQRLLAEKKQ